MRKHIFGITLFIAIVSLSVFIYEYFSYQEVTDCGRSMSEGCRSTVAPMPLRVDDFGDYTPEDMQVSIQYVEASMMSRTVKTRFKMEWFSDKEPPKAIWLQLRFNNWDKSDPGWTSDPVRIVSPFRKGDSIMIENSFDCGSCTKMPRNLYASASVWTRANVGTNLAYKIGEMIPVVVLENR